MKIMLWGAGYFCEEVHNMIKEGNQIIGIIDSDKKKQGTLWKGKIKIISPEMAAKSQEYEYIIVTVLQDEKIEILSKQLRIPTEKIVFYWRDNYNKCGVKNRSKIILEKDNECKLLNARLDSFPYEYGLKHVPTIISADLLLKKIKAEKKSLCRFGDGEFEIMRGNNRAWFQTKSDELQRRLIQIFQEKNDNVLTAAAQNFVGFERLKESAADTIRMYMAGETRTDIIKFFSTEKDYYDAYVSRPYILFREKKNAELIFKLFKQIWNNRNILMVEGLYGRTGVKNDLFKNAQSVRRIVCPEKNAWDCYEKILAEIERIAQPEDLVCVSLGPTATVLAYDLAQKGIQTLDIGQIDNEYDWFKSGVSDRQLIPGKMVAEIPNKLFDGDMIEREYEDQIVGRINTVQ